MGLWFDQSGEWEEVDGEEAEEAIAALEIKDDKKGKKKGKK